MANTVKKAIKVFKNEVGYQEKKTNSLLDSEHTNVGSNNFTKYGKEMGCNGQAWCLAFTEWCMVQAFGRDTAKKMLGGFSNYTPTGADYFKKIKRWFSEPKVGDFVFFYSSTLKRIAHVGFVYKVDSNKIYTIEGNTSSSSTEFERDGGCVAYKEYPLGSNRIKGYGRPLYESETKTTITTSDKTTSILNTWTKRLQKAIGAEVDGIAGKETLSKCPIIKLDSKGDVAKLLQEKFGVTTDGEIGAVSVKAIKTWQKKNGLSVDGIFGQNSWKKLLGL